MWYDHFIKIILKQQNLKNYYRLIKPIYVIGDLFILNGVFILILHLNSGLDSFFKHSDNILFFSYYNLTWGILTFFIPIYHLYRITRFTTFLNNILKFIILHFILIQSFKGMTEDFLLTNSVIFETNIIVFLTVPVWRVFIMVALKKYRRSGYNFRNVIIVGQDEASTELESFFKKHPEHGYRLIKIFDEQYTTDNLIAIESFCKENNIDELYCSMTELSAENLSRLTQFCQNNLIRIRFVPRAQGFNYKKLQVHSYDLLPVISLRPTPLDSFYNRLLKRCLDLLISLSVIILILSWLFPLLSLLIKLSSKGPIVFMQKRSGLNNRNFWCYKLRTMRVNNESDKIQATKGDNRITRIGAFLRKTSLDELPQFFNVLMGDMSIIGPRPHMIKHTEEYSKQIDNYMARHFIKPGITGLSQVMGYRGETEKLYQMRNRIKIDVFYLENWSFWLDIKILFLTIYNIIKGEEKAY